MYLFPCWFLSEWRLVAPTAKRCTESSLAVSLLSLAARVDDLEACGLDSDQRSMEAGGVSR